MGGSTQFGKAINQNFLVRLSVLLLLYDHQSILHIYNLCEFSFSRKFFLFLFDGFLSFPKLQAKQNKKKAIKTEEGESVHGSAFLFCLIVCVSKAKNNKVSTQHIYEESYIIEDIKKKVKDTRDMQEHFHLSRTKKNTQLTMKGEGDKYKGKRGREGKKRSEGSNCLLGWDPSFLHSSSDSWNEILLTRDQVTQIHSKSIGRIFTQQFTIRERSNSQRTFITTDHQ